MKLKEFFAQSKKENFLESTCIINIIWPAQPAILFLQAFLTRLKEIQQKSLITYNPHEQSYSEIQSQLSTSFLGTSCIYTFTLTDDTKVQTALISSLETYHGPHMVVVGTTQDQALRERSDILHLFVDEMIDQTTYANLYAFLKKEEATDIRFIQELFRRSQTVSLDMACIMMHYQLLVGKNNVQFFSNWFDRIVEEKHSLFVLSQHLFAQDAKRFYHTWQQVGPEYPPEFWIAFWSEQFWQSIIFTTIAQKEGAQVARKSVSRLPFSFMQKDWLKYSVAQLVATHNLLYQIDYANKHGAITEGLDLFFAKFLI